ASQLATGISADAELAPDVDPGWASEAPRSLGCLRRPHPAHVNARPVEPLQKRRELGRRQSHHAVLDRRPSEAAVLQSLRHQHEPGLVPEQELYSVGALGSEHINYP